MDAYREASRTPCAHHRLARQPARPPLSDAPRIVTVVSTEEEFDWSRPFERSNTSVESIRGLRRAQGVFDECDVKPTYVVDYPIATSPSSVAALKEVLAAGRCEIGAHLHPWVTPPHDEVVGTRNSFPGNLPEALERKKLEQLCAAIEAGLGVRPRCYQAGRYGFGANTAKILEELDFEVDLSASPGFDYSAEGGPDFLDLSPQAFWFGESRKLLAVPMSGAVIGRLPIARHWLYRTACFPVIRKSPLLPAIARLRLAERVRLSSEGFDHASLARLVTHLLDDGVRVFAFGLHSPSFAAGYTPYVKTPAELDRFLDQIRRFYDFFLGDCGGRHLTATEVRAELLDRSPPQR